jgi:mannose-6-phosphate isomerase-like protein (cupin superfamily)
MECPVELRKVSLADKFERFAETWTPKVVGEINDFQVKLVKLDGEFVWHHHDAEDELFLVVDGAIDMHYRDGDGRESVERFGRGEFLIVPHGVEHKPVATAGTKLLLLEPKTTVNTGSAGGSRTVNPDWL